MSENNWIDLGPVDTFKGKPLSPAKIGGEEVVVSYQDGKFGIVSGTCIHAGGPLAQGTLDGDEIVCPWHEWRFDCKTGGTKKPDVGLASYEFQERDGRLFVNPKPKRTLAAPKKEKHPLQRPIVREDGPIRVLGISTTAMNLETPRYSTSEKLLTTALDHAKGALGAETKLIKLNELGFRNCEGYYSKSAESCTWPCTITQMDKNDQMEKVYEALVFWADVVLVATPIRWGVASSLYFKMAERMNCIQNQITIADNVLIRNKTAAFIITGGQDNIQAVAGQMLTFFAELGFHIPQFPFIAHSRGWSAEDMEHNIDYVEKSQDLKEGAQELVARAVEHAKMLLERGEEGGKTCRAGRKASPVKLEAPKKN